MKKVRALLILAGVAFVILNLIPLAWIHSVSLDLPAFTAEWYKTSADIAKIVLAFVLANVLWERVKRERVSKDLQETAATVSRKWKALCFQGAAALANLRLALRGTDWEAVQLCVETLESWFQETEDFVSFGGAKVIDGAKGALPRHVAVFRDTVSPEVALILKMGDGGELVPGGELSPELSEAFEHSIIFFTNESKGAA